MHFNNNISSKTRINVNVSKVTNVVDLMKKAKLEEVKEKRGTVIIVAAAASVVAIAGLVIAL